MVPEIITGDRDWPYSKAKTSVLLAAAAVLREQGPRSATLKNISAKAGITEPAIFRHFQGIDGLFGGLFSVHERVSARLASVYEQGEPGLDRLLGAMTRAVEVYESAGDFAYLALHAEHVFRSYPEFRQRMAELRAEERARLVERVREASGRGELRRDLDPLTAAIALSGAVRASVDMWVESGYDFGLGDFWEERLGSLVILLSPSFRPAARADRVLS